MFRRDFITLVGSTVLSWPLAARGQQRALPVVGYLGSGLPGSSNDSNDSNESVTGFRLGLAEAGYEEGRNVAIEFRWAEGHYDRLPALADNLVNSHVFVILAGSLPSALAAKAATSTTPIVFTMGADPVALGVVSSLSRPSGNITGVTQFFGVVGPKRLELLRELLPAPGAIALLINPDNANAEDHSNQVQTAARRVGQPIEVFRATSDREIDAAFAAIVSRGIRALLVLDDPFFSFRREQLVALAARNSIPTIYSSRGFTVAGGLVSYGSSIRENNRQAGVYVGKILRGAKPTDLPVLQPTTFELVINLKTAKTLGLAIPPALLARADEVIE
jgi:putative ABC transport system substrate-binding protein